MSNTRMSVMAIGHLASQRSRSLIGIAFVVMLLGMLLTACGDDNAVAATEEVLPLDATPASTVDAAEGVNDVMLTVKSGTFEQTELVLLQNQQTKLYIRNDDDSDYMFEIVNMVEKTRITGGEETVLEFTTPNEGFYEARLSTGDGFSLKAKLAVVVAIDGETP